MNKHLIGLFFAASVVIAAPAFADPGPNSPTVTKGSGNALAAERAGRNSNGGDRAQGGFGQAQSDFVQLINSGATEWDNYGQFLQQWCADAGASQGCSAK